MSGGGWMAPQPGWKSRPLINFRVGAWQDFGYAEPPTPDCATIPPLGERSAKAIEAGHEAIKDIDQLIARLHQVRAQLVSELRQDEDIRAARWTRCWPSAGTMPGERRGRGRRVQEASRRSQP